jgi:hypothetical protein
MRSLSLRLLPVGLLLLLTAGIQARAGLVLNVFYDEITGTAVADLTDAAHFPNGPNPTIGGLAASLLVEELDYQPNQAGSDGVNDYGTHVRGFLYPPMDGDYEFFIASDDASELQLSSDATVDNLSTVAFESGCCTALFGGDRLEERRSEAITLSRGQIYYFEFFHKEGGGGDWYTIGWEKPDGTQEIIPTWYVEPFPLNEDGSNLQPRTGIAPEFPAQYFPNDFFPNNVPNSGHPESVTATEFRSATFGATVLAEPAANFQWQISTDGGSSWSDIDGETLPAYTVQEVSLDDDGNQYRVVASNSEGEVTSNAATLSVTPDTTPPEVTGVEVGIIDPNVLTLTFSEGLEESSAEDPANYSLNNDATVQSAELQDDGITVIVTADGIVDSQSGYELSVSGVRDRASSPNTMEPATFPLILFPGGLVQDANGFVVFEAENYDENVGDFWVEDTERGNPSGGASMVVPNGEGGSEDTAQLLYHVNFGQSGRHIVWYSASGDDGSDARPQRVAQAPVGPGTVPSTASQWQKLPPITNRCQTAWW